MPIPWRHQYDDERDKLEGDLAVTEIVGESLTLEHFAKEADINEIMRRFGVTDGAIPPAASDPRYFGDFSDVPDFRDSLDAVRDAQEKFDALPADLRKRFGNSPLELWEFVTDPANADEAVNLGLLKRTDPPAKPDTSVSAGT